MTTYLNAITRYYASDMICLVDSNATYLVLPKAKSRFAGCYYLSSLLLAPEQSLILNALILILWRTLCYIVLSVAEAETAEVFVNAQITIPIRCILECLGH